MTAFSFAVFVAAFIIKTVIFIAELRRLGARVGRLADRNLIIEKAVDEETLDLVKQLIALEDHLSDDAVRFGNIRFQKDKDAIRNIRKRFMRKLLHAPDQPPSMEVRRNLASTDCILKHLCLSFVILTEICDLLSRAGRDEEVKDLLSSAKNLNSMIMDYIGKARNILKDDKNPEVN
ncbi:hypothetical protein ES705_30993 [subsurface metagenome]